MILYYIILLFSAVPNHPWFGSEVGGVTFIKIMGAIALAYALFYMGVRRSFPPYFGTWPARFFLLLMGIASVSFAAQRIESVEYAGLGSPFGIYLSCILLFFVTLSVVDSRSRLRMSLLATIGAIGLASLYTVREWQVAGFSYYRPGYVAGDANYFAASALLTTPLSYYLFREKRPKWERFFCLGCLLMTMLAFIAASSRGGLVGLVCAMLYMFIRSERRVSVLVLAVLLVPLMLLSPISPIKRFTDPNYGDTKSVEVHQALWRAGLTMVAEHPITGVGLGGFKGLIRQSGSLDEIAGFSGKGLMAHNTYLEYAAELGIVALLLYLGILISTFFLLEKVRKHAITQGDDFFRAVAAGMQAGLIGFCGAAFFISAQYIKPFWILVFLTTCMPRLLQEHAAREDTATKAEPWREGQQIGLGVGRRTDGVAAESSRTDSREAVKMGPLSGQRLLRR